MTQALPFMTPELARSIEESITFFSKQNQEALRALPGNPYGIHLRTFGNATAFIAQHTYDRDRTSHVSNLREDDLPFLDELFEWYQSYGARPSITMVPPTASSVLLWQLASRGWYQSGFYNVLYGLPQEDSHEYSSDIAIRSVAPEEKELFVDAYCESFEVPNTDAYAYVRDSIGVIVGIPTNHCYFAVIDGEVAAIGAFSVYEQIGYLALGATRPHFQNLGCQKALLQRGLHIAKQMGCTLVAAQAAVASVSQHNTEKGGLRLAYTKATWTFFERQKTWDEQPDPLNR